MPTLKAPWDRLGMIVALIEKAPSQVLGRTAIVKLLYFLQTLRDVPLNYNFRLYIYGPFDEDVIDDIRYAESLRAVTSDLIYYSSGYGYDIRTGDRAKEVQQRAASFLKEYKDDVAWVIEKFGNYGASDLEMIGTLIFVDRETRNRGDTLSIDMLVNKVHEIKPHLDRDHVLAKAGFLQSNDILTSIS